MRLAYLGSPEAAVPPLRALVDAGHDVALVVTQPDKRRGRGSQLVPSPVKAAAQELGIPVTTKVDDVIDAGVELGIVVAVGCIIRPHVLDAVPMVNLHFSKLPRWRGAAPVERAILAGDTETAVAVMGVEEGLDTGPIHAEETVTIGEDETAEQLRARLVDIGTDLLVRTLERGLGAGTPQEGDPTYAAKIDAAELELDWTKSAQELHALTRITKPWTTFRGKRLRVLKARPTVARLEPGELDGVMVGCGSGALELLVVQPEGKAAQDAAAWRNGARPQPGERLG